MPDYPKYSVNEYDPVEEEEAKRKEKAKVAELIKARKEELKQRAVIEEGERTLRDINDSLNESTRKHREWQKKFERENYRDGKPIKRPKKK